VAPTYKSGAFAQQCFASHPLCLGLKKLTLPDLIVLACSSCQFQHHIRVRSMASQLSMAMSDVGEQVGKPEEHLARCSRDHPAALRVGGMDVVQESLALRCAECRRVYTIEVVEFETHGR
jgi:hypothetical protein